MNITIVGGGNVGTQFAVHCAEKKHRVIIYSSKPESFSKELTIIDENNKEIHKGLIYKATNSAKEAFSNAEIIFVTVPAFAMKDIADKIYPYIKEGVKIGLIPGTGGGECAFKECLTKKAIIFGLQRVPSVARLIEYGKKVCATGYKKELFVAALPNKCTEECVNDIANIFNMQCNKLPNFLNLTLTPSNPILHTTRLKTIFNDYKENKVYESVPLFYEEWDNNSSELLLKCDEEVQEICRKLSMFDLSVVKSLKEHYESANIEELTNKIRSIQSLKGLKTPVIEKNEKYIPDLNSRYFIADFNFGLTILIQIAVLFNVQTPNMIETLEWYNRINVYKKVFNFSDYNIKNQKDFINFYNQ